MAATRPGLWLCAAAILIVLGVAGRNPARIAAPFGPSHDGFNAALYLAGGRALVEDGLLDSRLGASVGTLSGDRIVYAHHPPLIYLVSGASVAIIGDRETAARLVAVLSSLGAVLLVALILSSSGVRDGASAFGVTVAFLTPMFVMFGITLEPHVMGLAPMLAIVLLWQRVRLGRTVPYWLLAGAAAVAVLTSWQAALVATLVSVGMFVFDRRRADAAAVLAGIFLASVFTALWIVWAYDGRVGDFLERAMHRTGNGTGQVTLRDAIGRQTQFFADLFPVGGWLMVPVASLGLFDRRTRFAVAVTLTAVLAYAVLFRNGASDHNYWLYCVLAPLAMSTAVVADAIATKWGRSRTGTRILQLFSLMSVAALLVAAWRPSDEEGQRRRGMHIGSQARALHWPLQQRYAYHMFGDEGPTDLLPWLLYYSRRPPYGVSGPEVVPPSERVLRFDGEEHLILVAGTKQAVGE